MADTFEDRILGETGGTQTLGEREACRLASLALVQQARRGLDIFSRDLDAALYDHSDFLDAIKELATASRHTHVRILIQDSEPAVKYGNRLVELARRLTTAMEIRLVHPDLRDHTEAFLVADAAGYLHRQYSSRYEATLSFNDPFRARELLQFFEAAWNHSLVDNNLRRLHL